MPSVAPLSGDLTDTRSVRHGSPTTTDAGSTGGQVIPGDYAMMVDVRETSGSEDDPHLQDKIDLIAALIRAIDDMDRINAMVRASANGNAAKTALMASPFMYTEEQAQHVLDLTLRRQTRKSQSDLAAELSRLHGQS